MDTSTRPAAARRPSLASPHTRTLAALALGAGLMLAGCASGGSDDSAGGSSSAQAPMSASEAEPRAGTEQDATVASRAGAADKADGAVSAVDAPGSFPPEQTRPAVIQTGTVTLEGDDVAGMRFDLDKVVDSLDGTIADEKTTATSEGEVRMSRLVLRVPSQDFDAAMTGLGKLGEVTDATRKAEDVTGEVIDTQARIRAQEQSLARVEVLFGRATAIRDVVAIEAQLSRRQAELDSLKGQLAWLEDQSSLSTITVYLERSPREPRVVPEDDEPAFVVGLRGGWQALVSVGAGLAAVLGALLPFAVVGAVLGVPAWVLLRRWLSRHPLRRPTAEA